ncbi:Lrp/AsnC family transcriptional regulator [Candidatus Woesearchaeota archaeon]|nr:Lrp/AsnC family transcriptional regulator [Candidatus Woesearchaeota archaeon]
MHPRCIQRLEEERIITQFTAIVDMAKLGFFTFRIYIRFRQMTRAELNNLVGELKNQENVWTIAICHGKWDLAFFIGTKTINVVHEAWDSLLKKYKTNIETYNFCFYSPIFNFNRAFFLDEKKESITRVYGESVAEETDEIDWKIIRRYAPDVRQPILGLSRVLKLSPETIKKRIARLEKKKIICGYKIGLDINTLGYTSYRIDLTLISTSKNKAIFEYCRYHKNIYQINKTVGGADFEIELVVKDLNELLEIIEDIKARFKDVVDNASYFSYSTYYLLNYIPD